MRPILRFKIWRIESSIKKMLIAKQIKPLVWWFGAYFIHPKHLVFVVGVPTDDERDKLKSDIEFNNALRELLVKYKWPKKARAFVTFDIESDETVQRETDGNWWYHYK